MQKFSEFANKHLEILTVLGLGILFYFLFFHNLGTYALMDVDETRYVLMSKDMFNSKDFLTLYMNGEYFFEKPPLYFWGECLSFAIFGQINEFTARFPVALYGTLCCYLTYYMGKLVFSRAYGVVSSIILGTSVEFVILSKFAILDILVSTCVWFSLCFGIIAFFCKENHKKYYWWLFYLFSGLAVMAKGIPGFVIPVGSILLISLYTRTFKEIFKPKYIIIGTILFFTIVIPWHALMLKMHSPLFFNEYIIKHHVARFIGGNELGRAQPFYFYIITILWGFFPWVLSSLTVLINKIKTKSLIFNNLNRHQFFLMFNGIITLFIIGFFSISDTKLITYILPVYGSLSCLAGYVWIKYIKENEFEKLINPTVYIIGSIFIVASILALFSEFYLPSEIVKDLSSAKVFSISVAFIFGITSIYFVKQRKYTGVFITYVLLITIVSAFGTPKYFNIDYKYGQEDLINFAKYAKENDKSITTFNFSNKFSLDYYSGKQVEFLLNKEIEDLNQELNKESNLVILEPKKLDKETLQKIKYKEIKKGRKYILIERE